MTNAPLFNLYLEANPETEDKGLLHGQIHSSKAPMFANAINYLNREPAAVGVWLADGSSGFYIERATQ